MYLQNVFRRCFLTVLSDVLFLSDFPISKLLTDQIRSPFGISKTPIQLKFSGFFFFFSWEIKVRLLCEGGWGVGGPTQSPEYQIMVEYWFGSGELNEFCVYTFIILQIYSFDLNRFHLNCIPCRPRYLRIVALYTDKTVRIRPLWHSAVCRS